MPNIKSAKKRMDLNNRWNEVNRKKRATLRTAIKRVRAAEKAEEAQELFQKATVLIDRAAGNNLVHRNKAARLKSQLARHVASL